MQEEYFGTTGNPYEAVITSKPTLWFFCGSCSCILAQIIHLCYPHWDEINSEWTQIWLCKDWERRCMKNENMTLIPYHKSQNELVTDQTNLVLCPVHVILEVLKLSSNLKSLFSFNFQLKKSCNWTLHFGTHSSY